MVISWNRIGHRHEICRQYEAAGAAVIVAENGWIHAPGRKFYALCLNHHNGAGRWHVGADDRFGKLGIDLKPWREKGDHILVLPQRGIGEPGIAMPRQWMVGIEKRLKESMRLRRPIRMRHHPGQSDRPLEPDLENCHAVVTWASGAAIKAIAAGVPAFYELKDWIGGPAAKRGFKDLEAPFLGDRMPMFHRLSWAQWTADEISTGEPFKWLLALRSQ